MGNIGRDDRRGHEAAWLASARPPISGESHTSPNTCPQFTRQVLIASNLRNLKENWVLDAG
jgi:hypothetical protein